MSWGVILLTSLIPMPLLRHLVAYHWYLRVVSLSRHSFFTLCSSKTKANTNNRSYILNFTFFHLKRNTINLKLFLNSFSFSRCLSAWKSKLYSRRYWITRSRIDGSLLAKLCLAIYKRQENLFRKYLCVWKHVLIITNIKVVCISHRIRWEHVNRS